MIVNCMLLVEGASVRKDSLNISLDNAKLVVIGKSSVFGFIVHLAANSANDLQKAVLRFSEIPHMTTVTLLRLQPG